MFVKVDQKKWDPVDSTGDLANFDSQTVGGSTEWVMDTDQRQTVIGNRITKTPKMKTLNHINKIERI